MNERRDNASKKKIEKAQLSRGRKENKSSVKS